MEFWAGLVSGAAGIVIGNPFDIIKVQLQISKDSNSNNNRGVNYYKIRNNRDKSTLSNLISSLSNNNLRLQQEQQQQSRKYVFFPPRKNISLNGYRNNLRLVGIAAPVLGHGGLNGLLFMTYNRMITLLNNYYNKNNNESDTATVPTHDKNDHLLWTTFVAGAMGGLATWIISTPTELIKCRAQAQIRAHDYGNISNTTFATHQQQQQKYLHNCKKPTSSWEITKKIIRYEGVRGLYFGGLVTALRDSIGYGFYFWSYTFTTRAFNQMIEHKTSSNFSSSIRQQDVEVAKMLICGGIAGIATWASVFPLDLIKTRVQTQLPNYETNMNSIEMENNSGTTSKRRSGRLTALKIFQNALVNEGPRVFFNGLTICSIRAFIVNAVQWSVYEWIMQKSSNNSNNVI